MSALDSVDIVAHAVTIAAAFALWWPIAHKAKLVRAGTGLDDPLVRARPWLAEHPAAWLSVATAAEIAVSVLLVVAPAAGSLGLAALCATYSSQLGQLSPSATCECFGKAIGPMRAMSALRRNLALTLVGTVTGCAYLVGGVQVTTSPIAFGLATVMLSPFAAHAFLARAGYGFRRPAAAEAGRGPGVAADAP